MKKTLTIIGLAILASILMVAPCFSQDQTDETWGPETIGGAGVGYGIDGSYTRQTFVYQFAGLKLKTLDFGAIFLCYQRGFIEGTDVGGNGAKIILADRWTKAPDFTWLMGLGFIDNIKAIEDGTELKAALTVDGGLTYSASQWIEIGIYGQAWDTRTEFSPDLPIEATSAGIESEEPRGGTSWSISVVGVIKDPLDLISGLWD